MNNLRAFSTGAECESLSLRQLSKFASFPCKPLAEQVVAEFESDKFENGFLKDIRNSPCFQTAFSEISRKNSRSFSVSRYAKLPAASLFRSRNSLVSLRVAIGAGV